MRRQVSPPREHTLAAHCSLRWAGAGPGPPSARLVSPPGSHQSEAPACRMVRTGGVSTGGIPEGRGWNPSGAAWPGGRTLGAPSLLLNSPGWPGQGRRQPGQDRRLSPEVACGQAWASGAETLYNHHSDLLSSVGLVIYLPGLVRLPG